MPKEKETDIPQTSLYATFIAILFQQLRYGPAKLSISRQMTKENVYAVVEYHSVLKKIETPSFVTT